MAGMSPVASVVAQPSKSLMEVASTLNLSKWEFFIVFLFIMRLLFFF